MTRTPAGVAALYPFLYGDAGDAGDAMPTGYDASAAARELTEQLVRSTSGKIREAARLRQEVLDAAPLDGCAEAMAEQFAAGGRLLVMGNGGSSSDCFAVASLFVRPPSGHPLPCLSLTADGGVLSALANDVGFDVVFARQVAALARPADMVMGISTSGNSENLCRGFDEAARRGLATVGFAGYDGGRMAALGTIDFLFVVPSMSVHRVQEGQTTLLHELWGRVQAHLFSEAIR